MSSHTAPADRSALRTGVQAGTANEVAELARHVWYWYLIAGVISVVFGVIVLSNVLAGLAALVWLAGFFLLYAGIVDLTSASLLRPRWLSALMGIVAIAGGIAALAWPGMTLRALALLLGISFVAWGIARVLVALQSRAEGWIWLLVGGAASVVVGVVAMVYPGLTVFVLAVMLGVNSLIWGVFAIAQALALRRVGKATQDGPPAQAAA
jgi:uncharacterized membrane protein HdeD (DUF308 family)